MNFILKIIIKVVLMIVIGLSAIGFTLIGVWALIPWTISWILYDLNQKTFKEEKNGNDSEC
jgi:hypothetical protein